MSQEIQQTPMMAQYLAIKAQYPDAILFYRLGDFYEMFNEDALEAAKVLEITLTARNKKADHPIPMCGVPFHSAKDYIRRLIDQGYKVAICEQMEDPKLTKGMVKREVIRVITPGTILEEDALNMKENNFLAAIDVIDECYYLAYVDISTGEVCLTQTPDKQQALNELLAIQPKEFIYPEKPDSQALAQALQQSMSLFLSAYQNEEVYTDQVAWSLADASPAEAQLLNFLFNYLYSVQKQAIHHMKPVVRYELANYLQMNHYAKTQLELTKSLRTQRKKGSLLWLIDQTKTAMGGRLLHQWLEKPLLNRKPLELRHQKVKCLMNAYFERMDLVQALEKVYDLERLVTKIAFATANARDIDQLHTSLQQIKPINQFLSQINAVNGQEIFPLLAEFEDLMTAIQTCLVEEPPLSITEGNIIQTGYHPDLDRYRDAMAHGNQWLSDLQQREREITGLKTLKVGYNKVFGYYIEISRLQAAQLNDARYLRKQTLSNNERFITEELKTLETTILEAQEKSKALEYELFVALREQVATYKVALQTLASQVAELDVLANFASLSQQEDYCQAEIADHPQYFKLEASRHPAIEKLIGKAAFVPNDLQIEPNQSLLLLTGPNMSGKSTYMRQVAFCVILNQIGCFVPAKSAVLPLVDQIFTRIGASDDIASGQSTFMVEMMETNLALRQATPNSLLLFDEIGRGTATFDGMALAEAILYYIARQVKAATIFSTHYHELTALTDKLKVLKNIHVGAKEVDGQVVFLHKILDGPADKSYGIHVAKLAGLPYSLIEQSQVILQELELKGQTLRSTAQAQPDTTATYDLFQLAQIDDLTDKMQAKQAVIDQLMSTEIDNLTPLAALQLLAQLQSELKD